MQSYSRLGSASWGHVCQLFKEEEKRGKKEAGGDWDDFFFLKNKRERGTHTHTAWFCSSSSSSNSKRAGGRGIEGQGMMHTREGYILSSALSSPTVPACLSVYVRAISYQKRNKKILIKRGFCPSVLSFFHRATNCLRESRERAVCVHSWEAPEAL